MPASATIGIAILTASAVRYRSTISTTGGFSAAAALGPFWASGVAVISSP